MSILDDLICNVHCLLGPVRLRQAHFLGLLIPINLFLLDVAADSLNGLVVVPCVDFVIDSRIVFRDTDRALGFVQ
jgi:hypothetical protein